MLISCLLLAFVLVFVVVMAFQDGEELEDKSRVLGEASKWSWDVRSGGKSPSPLVKEITKLVSPLEGAKRLVLYCDGRLPSVSERTGGERRVYMPDVERLGDASARDELKRAVQAGCAIVHAGFHRTRGYREGSEGVVEMLKACLRRDDLDALAIRVVELASDDSIHGGTIAGTVFGFSHRRVPDWLRGWLIPQ